MERKIKLVMKDSSHYWMKGVYQIRIGRLRYIGKAVCVGDRMYQHQLAINKAIKNYSYWLNVGYKDESEEKTMKSYVRLAKYLNENPSIETGMVEILQREVCSMKLYYTEHQYLSDVSGNPDFYNSSWTGSRPRHDHDHLWDVEVSNDRIEYFDPRIKGARVLSTNTNSQNKEILKQINAVKESKQFKIQRLGEKKGRMIQANPERKGAILTYILDEMQKVYKGEI